MTPKSRGRIHFRPNREEFMPCGVWVHRGAVHTTSEPSWVTCLACIDAIAEQEVFPATVDRTDDLRAMS